MFQASRVSKPPADTNVMSSAAQHPVSEQASLGTHEAGLSVGGIQATGELSEGNLKTNAMSMDEIPATEGEHENVIPTCSAMSSSSVSNVTVVSVSTQQTSTATTTCDVAQTSKGVVIRPIITAAEPSGKE